MVLKMRKTILLTMMILASCIAIDGPCKVEATQIVCHQGGSATIFKPDTTIDSLREDDERRLDPRIVVPPKMRN